MRRRSSSAAGLNKKFSLLARERDELLAQQTASAEILQVINRSPGDLTPVFNTMLEKAMRLCEAAFGQLAAYDGERFLTSATQGVPAAFAEYRRNNPPNYGPGTTPSSILEGERVIRTDDLKAERAYQLGEPNRRALVDLGGVRSALIVALRKDNAVLGFIQIYRQEVRPFSDKQIALLHRPLILDLKQQGILSLSGIARGLNARGIPTARSGQRWTTTQVARVLERHPI